MTPQPISSLLEARGFVRLAAVLLTLPYWTSGIAKLFDLDGAFAEAAHFGLSPVWLVVAATIFVQVGGSALVILGRLSWLGAGGARRLHGGGDAHCPPLLAGGGPDAALP